MLNPSSLRGLSTFISDLRACRSREQEQKRINKEMANVRAKFKEGNLSSYQKKKYICKLLYIYLLGTEVDFGHVEATNLITGIKYSEKVIGYLAVTLLLSENDDLVRLVINSMRKDLEDRQETFNCLALQAIANLGGREIAESLSDDVFKLLVSSNSINFVKKKAALCLLRLYRKNADVVPISDWASKICALMEDHDVGVNMCLSSLIIGLSGQHAELLTPVIPLTINKLHSIVVDKMYTPDNVYYFVPAPWLQMKLCRLLQCFPPPEGRLRDKLFIALRAIFNSSNDIPKNVQHNNALNCVIVEAIHLALHIDPESDLVPVATNLAARYVVSKETNMKYLGLEIMTKLATYSQCLDTIKKHREGVFIALADRDISIRRRSLDLLYTMCDQEISKQVVEELLGNLSTADHAMKEDMVLKIAILTERFAEESTWYVDVTLRMIDVAGEHVSDDVWHRVIQIITNNNTLHGYAVKQVMGMLQNAICNEYIVKVGAYLFGEFGDLIANDSGCSPIDQFLALNSKFGICSNSTKTMLLNTFVKFINIFPEIKPDCMRVLQQHQHSLDPELQQRACEYIALASMPTDELLQTIFEQMPPFPTRESALVKRLREKENYDNEIGTDGRQRRVSVAVQQQQTRESGQMPAVAENSAPNVTEDLLDIAGSSAAPVASGGASGLDMLMGPAGTHEPASTQQISQWFLNLITKNSGILYEDSVLQIGLKAEFQGSSGRLLLFLGNKSQSSLTGIEFAVDSVDGLDVQVVDPVKTVPPSAQLQQAISITCTKPFASPPGFKITMPGQSYIQFPKLMLPVFVSKFNDPVTMAGGDFMNRWKTLGPSKEAQEVFKGAPQTVPEAAKVKDLLTSLQLGILEGVDPNANNCVAAGVIQTSTAGKVGMLLRLEINVEQAAYRLTVRTTSEQAAKPLALFIKTCILKLVK